MGLRELWRQFAASGGDGLPPVDGKNLKRRKIYFSGEVQAVGFRYRCKIHADQLGVTGWCMNLSDGRVKGEFQSDDAHLDALIRAMENEPWITITHMEVTSLPVEPGEREFTVDYF
jgi:acylphosphatase